MRTIWKHELAVGDAQLGYEIPGYGGVAHVTRSGPGGRIREGDPIAMTDEGARHGDCDAAEPAPAREHPVCPVCWLTHPEGACDR